MQYIKKPLVLVGLFLSTVGMAGAKPKYHPVHPAQKMKRHAKAAVAVAALGDACPAMMKEMMARTKVRMAKGGPGMEKMWYSPTMQTQLMAHLSKMGKGMQGKGNGLAKGKAKQLERANQAACLKAKREMETCWRVGGQSCRDAGIFFRRSQLEFQRPLELEIKTLPPKTPKYQQLLEQLGLMKSVQRFIDNLILKKL